MCIINGMRKSLCISLLVPQALHGNMFECCNTCHVDDSYNYCEMLYMPNKDVEVIIT